MFRVSRCTDLWVKVILLISGYLKIIKGHRMHLSDLNIDQSWSLFLDRDGVINKRIPGAYVSCWEEFEFLPGALEAIEAISSHFRDRMWVAAGTVLDPATAREVILHGGSLIVSPVLEPSVIALANSYGVPMYSGAFTATDTFNAMKAGAAMVKIFPAQVAGPAYMTNLRMVFPEVNQSSTSSK